LRRTRAQRQVSILWAGPRLDSLSVDYSGGNAASRAGIKFIDFQSNQSSPDNGQAMYVDYDDIEVWNTTPPATDSFGDPWIGPLKGYSGG
jgi:hypothetical protein